MTSFYGISLLVSLYNSLFSLQSNFYQTKITYYTQVVPDPVSPYSAESWPKTPFIHSFISVCCCYDIFLLFIVNQLHNCTVVLGLGCAHPSVEFQCRIVARNTIHFIWILLREETASWQVQILWVCLKHLSFILY